MRLKDVGEFGLIERIRAKMPDLPGNIRLGMGDDAAIYETDREHFSVITTDALIENSHFDRSYTPMDALGWKTLAVNLSDLAAMGASPVCAVISLALKATCTTDDIDRFYTGLSECSRTFNCPVVGGDTTKAGHEMSIGITVIGSVPKGEQILRSNARPGDKICVTGSLGKSKTGLEVLSSGTDTETDAYTASVNAFLRPVPRIEAGVCLADFGYASAMIDISDGLARDLSHICRSSHAGCRIDAEQIPVHEEAGQWSRSKGLDPVLFALGSGEEYELLFTVPKNQWHSFETDRLFAHSLIGEMVPESSGLNMIFEGTEKNLDCSGWDHFTG